jgi:hypothetical protein
MVGPEGNFMRYRQLIVMLALLPLGSCVTSPLSRTNWDSRNAVTISGYVPAKGDKITIQAMDQNTGVPATLGHAVSTGPGIVHTTSGGITYTMYPWAFPAGVLASNYWSPQAPVDDLKTSQGHLEIIASDGGQPFATYSPGAVQAAMAAGTTVGISAGGFSDGTSTVQFDQSGTGNPAHGPWVNSYGMKMTQSGYPQVAWSAGYYTVEGGKNIYALICAPTSGGPYPAVIFNHGGIDSPATPTGGDLTGVIASGWTVQPNGATDSLGQCLDWAKRGWVFATSAYRGSTVTITQGTTTLFTHQSGGTPEFCLGEVTDVLALTDIVANYDGSIAIGPSGSTITPNFNGKLFMYGYSHGGCITYRAVEQGAPVNAFSVIEGFTDLRQTYLDARQDGDSTALSAAIAGAYQTNTTTTYQPDAAGVMGYNWRSAHYFASRGDLAIQNFKNMPILIFHGDNEVDIDPVTQVHTPNPTSLAQAALISPDIAATNIFIGPAALAPSTEPCIAGAPGAQIATLSATNAMCPIGFLAMNTTDPCTNGAFWFLTQCNVLELPLTPSPGYPVQQHYFVVYHNMNHINGGLGILATFGHFVQNIFSHQAGCSGLVVNCASD